MTKVKGYMLRTPEMRENGQEQIFALHEDGTLKTCIRKYSSTFHERGNAWVEAKTIPSEAEFIGNYPLS